MARFDIFENKGGASYLLDVQSDLLGGLNTRVVVPLLLAEQQDEISAALDMLFLGF